MADHTGTNEPLPPNGWIPVTRGGDRAVPPAAMGLADLLAGVSEVRARIRALVVERDTIKHEHAAKQDALDVFSTSCREKMRVASSAPRGGVVMQRLSRRNDPGQSFAGVIEFKRTTTGYGANASSGYVVAGTTGVTDSIGRATTLLYEASRKRIGRGKLLEQAETALGRGEVAINAALEMQSKLRTEFDRRLVECDAEIRSQADALNSWVATVSGAIERSVAQSPVTVQPGWALPTWQAWQPPDDAVSFNLGQVEIRSDPKMREVAAAGSGSFPLTVGLRALRGLHLRHDAEHRDAAHAAARNIIARLLAAIPPGKARFTFFDPLGLGQAVSPFLALADHDPKLVDGKVWTNADNLRSRLTEMTSHIENVIQKYLRGQYETIEEFNDEAGEIAEPYRILVVFDFPAIFDETTFHHLCRVIENGPRCGVYTVLVTDLSAPTTYGVATSNLPGDFPTLTVGGLTRLFGPSSALIDARVELEVDPIRSAGSEAGQAIIDHIVDAVGRAGRGADNVIVTFDRAMGHFADAATAGVRSDVPSMQQRLDLGNSATWWNGSTRDRVVAPIGQSGARDVAALGFDSETQAGALLVGRPGSGKSTLLHTYIAGLSTLYSPSELELYLIDFKEGVEFKAYGEYGLPHARCVAVESEREFGLNVLESIVEEMRQRAVMIRAGGGQYTTFGNARDANGGVLPRVVLVFDEFHVLFAEDDRLGAAAASALETIVRQGRGFGVHLVLGSQSLAGLDALPRHVLQLLPVRILLPSSESDAHMVLGESNPAWKLLGRRGEGVLNPSAGAIEANVVFQTAFQTDDERTKRLIRLREYADQRGFDRRPVVFEGAAAARFENEGPAAVAASLRSAGESRTALRLGTPMSLEGPVSVDLRRESGSNLLVVAKPTNDVPLGVLTSAILSAAAWSPMPRIEVVDFTSIDDGFEDAIAPFVTQGLQIARRRKAPSLIESIATEVASRVTRDQTRERPIVLFLNGLHRARDLDANASEFRFDDDEPETGYDLLAGLRTILTDGPEVGVHTVAWIDSVTSLRKRLPQNVHREFALRVGGTMSRDDSVDLLDVDLAAWCKPYQVIVFNDDDGTARRATSFAPPDHTWLTAALNQLTGGH